MIYSYSLRDPPMKIFSVRACSHVRQNYAKVYSQVTALRESLQ